MFPKRAEVLLAALVGGAMAALPCWILMNESRAGTIRVQPPRVLTLTGVARTGVWTEEDVVGHNYWRRSFAPARPAVRVGEIVVLRLKSADVSHSFSIPDLEVGPIAVEPGHVALAHFVALEPGEYLYQCSTRCGPCHEEMTGTLVVLGPGQTMADYPAGKLPPRTKCPHQAGE